MDKGNTVRAKKALSQNWLVDGNLARKLVGALELSAGTTVLEVGPGTGALTKIMLEAGANVVAIEKDAECVEFLRTQYGNNENLTLIEGDVLDMSLAEMDLSPDCRFISNLPYAITTPILFHVMESRVSFSRLVVTMQKEVGDRLTASPGTKSYGRLTVMLSVYGEVKRLFSLPPSVFRPSPAVVSVALAIDPAPDRWLSSEKWRQLSRLVKAAFSTRRKMIAKCISRELAIPAKTVRSLLTENGFDCRIRPESLTSADFVRLSTLLSSYLT